MSFGIQDTVHRLKSYNDSAFPILSIYFHPIRDGKSVQTQLYRYIESALSDFDKEQVAQNILYMNGFVAKYRPKYADESLAIFSGDNILFEIIHLPYPIDNQIMISHSPFLEPLFTQQQIYRRYLIIAVDRARAKFFTICQGVIEKQGEVIDSSVPQNVHADSSEANNLTREDKINRHIQDHIHRHFQTITKHIEEFIQHTPVNGVIIGGHKNLFHKFESHLPYLLREKVVGEFVTELNVPISDILQKSNDVIKKVDDEFLHQHSPYLSTSH